MWTCLQFPGCIVEWRVSGIPSVCAFLVAGAGKEYFLVAVDVGFGYGGLFAFLCVG